MWCLKICKESQRMAMPYYRKKKDAAEQSFKNGWDLLNQRNT